VRASSAGDAGSRLVQPLANVIDGLAKRTSVHRDHGATFAAGELRMIANPIDRLLILVRAPGTGNLHVRVVNWTSGHRLVSSAANNEPGEK
jgi:hypothetical protein